MEQRVKCPKCASFDTRLSRKPRMLDTLMEAFGRLAYRCRACGLRFYRHRTRIVKDSDWAKAWGSRRVRVIVRCRVPKLVARTFLS